MEGEKNAKKDFGFSKRSSRPVKSFPGPASPLSGDRMKIFPDLWMTSLLLTLFLVLFPSPAPVSGATKRKEYVESCYRGEARFKNDTTCSWHIDDREVALEPACCTFIFSFGELESRWDCTSDYDLELCEGADDSCTKYEKDPSGRSVRCLCTEQNCNSPNQWEKDPIFRQWNKLPGNRKKGSKGEGTDTKPCGLGPGGEGGFGGVAAAGGRGDLATVSALLLIGALSHRHSSVPFVLLTLGVTLPSIVSGGFQGATDLTCLSSSNATDDWGDRHCGEEIETCCYYIFREVPNWDCADPRTCELRLQWSDDHGDGQTLCTEHFDGPDRPPALLCHCNTNNCNDPEEWAEDVLYQQWKKEWGGPEGQGKATTEDPYADSKGTRGEWATAGALLRAMFAIIF